MVFGEPGEVGVAAVVAEVLLLAPVVAVVLAAVVFDVDFDLDEPHAARSIVLSARTPVTAATCRPRRLTRRNRRAVPALAPALSEWKLVVTVFLPPEAAGSAV
jgi:hypothetical protein